ncbi:MAG: phosphoribosylaminoimidazole carboxylase [Nitrospira bacterium SM23_35]|jgi:phosphoribosylaminoimidazole carboxylase PurE protein|nr:MAG: phosphoribosylaminoimidazole carboxylase [Nitrospira bacterium SM23_35]
MKPWVLIVLGSDSDLPVMENALKVLKELQIPCTMTVASAHRSPGRAIKLATDAEKEGYDVIIAGAGMAAHLAGVLAAHTVIPVIGVPLNSSPLNGLDSLLSTVQMPPGVPVATMAIGNAGARNAAFFAAQIIGRKNPEIAKRLKAYKKKMADEIEKKARAMQRDTSLHS